MVSLSFSVEEPEQSIKRNTTAKKQNDIPEYFRRELNIFCFMMTVFVFP
ncbi:hypothetical protein [Chryseobacterium sp.]|nr:hypothetical protein [Chryseobacterium sp.]